MKNKFLFVLLILVLITALLPVNIYVTVIFSVLVLLLGFSSRYIDGTFAFLMLFSVFYSLIIFLNGEVVSVANTISYVISPVAFYTLGKLFTDKVDSKQKYIAMWTIIIACYIFPLGYKTLYSISEFGVVNIYRMLGGEGDEALAATLYGLHASVGLSAISILFCKIKGIGWQKFILLICTSLSLLCVVHLVNRAGLVVLACTIFVCVLYNIKIKPYNILIFCFLFGFLFFVVDKVGLIGEDVLSAYQSRELAAGADASSMGGRVDLWFNALKHLFTDPMGFKSISHFAHNLWLDIARVSGIIPFIFFLFATINNYSGLYRYIKRGDTIVPFILGLNVALFLSSFVEPVIEGSFLYFYILLFLWGCNRRLLYKQF